MNGKNSSLIGFMLLFLLFMVYTWVNSPSQKQTEEYKKALKKYQDSVSNAFNETQKTTTPKVDSVSLNKLRNDIVGDSTLSKSAKDSLLKSLEKSGELNSPKDEKLAVFSAASGCEEKTFTVENNELVVTFSNRGGRIIDVKVKNYLGYNFSTKDKYDKSDVHLLNNKSDIFSYFIPVTGAARGGIQTKDLCFEPEINGKTIVFRAYSNEKKGFIEQKYDLSKGYLIDYDLKLENLRDIIPGNSKTISLLWHAHLPKIEKNPEYERRMTSIHFKEASASPSYCNCAADANKKLEKNVQWVSYAQQFFNTSLIFNGQLKPSSGDFQTFMKPESAPHLKELKTTLNLPIADASSFAYDMQFYIGPNEHNTLSALNIELEQVIPFGWSIFGVISRYVIRPMFNFFAMIIPNYGIIIILLTLLIRVLIFPLQFSMLKSGVKMSILRPKLDELKKKYKDDPSGLQMEQMRMYGEYGVSPLAGCLPMLLTMPIWIALYRFFPASIEFRQKSFLWADDLVSYDSVWDFGYVPIIGDFYGDHVSLFTLLWCISMFAFLFYNSKQMDMSAGGANAKMMMYMQYAFPVIFFFALNSWAAGLTCYMLFSNLLNILQTFLVKNVIIDKKKLEAQMEHRKNNPKPKTAFQLKYEEALKQQQEAKKNKNK